MPVAAPVQAPGRRADPLLLVIAGVAAGIAVAAARHPRTGIWVCSVSLGVGALLRLTLTARAAGSLVVRRRLLDVTVLLGLAVALGVLAAVTPFPGQGG